MLKKLRGLLYHRAACFALFFRSLAAAFVPEFETQSFFNIWAWDASGGFFNAGCALAKLMCITADKLGLFEFLQIVMIQLFGQNEWKRNRESGASLQIRPVKIFNLQLELGNFEAGGWFVAASNCARRSWRLRYAYLKRDILGGSLSTALSDKAMCFLPAVWNLGFFKCELASKHRSCRWHCGHFDFPAPICVPLFFVNALDSKMQAPKAAHPVKGVSPSAHRVPSSFLQACQAHLLLFASDFYLCGERPMIPYGHAVQDHYDWHEKKHPWDRISLKMSRTHMHGEEAGTRRTRNGLVCLDEQYAELLGDPWALFARLPGPHD